MSFEVRGLTKAYAGAVVLDGVDLAVPDGEIHALVGANGAGKSTLIKCVGGAVAPDAGTIALGDRTHAALAPKAARDAGIAVIYQDFSLAPTLSVAENIFLGTELRRGPFVRRREQRRRARRLLESLDATIDPDGMVEELPGAGQQIVEIAKAMRREPSLLILDEPTASLTEREATRLADHLRALRKRRLPILYVTHRLDEVFELADRVTVLRDGRVVLTAPVGEVTRVGLVEAIVGGAGLSGQLARQRGTQAGAQVLLEVRGLVAPAVGPIDLDVRQGEIFGIFGLLGSGRTELLEAIFAVRPLEHGRLRLDGTPVRFRRPVDAIEAGVALVPSERRRKSLFMPLTSLENVLLPSLGRVSRGWVRRRSIEGATFSKAASLLQLRPPRPNMQASRFSGGNQQKLAVGRWLGSPRPLRLLLLDEPTQGVDVGARAELYATLRNAVADGSRAAVVTSSDAAELALLADRVAVLSRGRIVGELAGEAITERRLLELAHLGE